MKTNKKIKDYNEYIENNILATDLSSRGGNIKVDVSELFPEILETGEDAICGAYQNYLGGGLLGAIQSGRMFDIDTLTEENQAIYKELTIAIKRFFHAMTNEGQGEWNESSYEENQEQPVSAY